MSKRVVKFGQLPSAVRERFLASLSAPPEAPQSPIASESIGRTRARVTLAVLLALSGALACILFMARDMLNAQTGVIYLLMCLPAVLIFWFSISRLVRQNPFAALPFAPGRYLFALDYVDARGPSLVIRSLSSASFRCVHHHINGGYVHTQFVFTFDDGEKLGFTFGDRAMATWALGKLEGVQGTIRTAAHRGDAATLMALDPFFELHWA